STRPPGPMSTTIRASSRRACSSIGKQIELQRSQGRVSRVTMSTGAPSPARLCRVEKSGFSIESVQEDAFITVQVGSKSAFNKTTGGVRLSRTDGSLRSQIEVLQEWRNEACVSPSMGAAFHGANGHI